MGDASESERYQRSDGSLTDNRDPGRQVWYSPECGYWTDDWTALDRWGIIPTCPFCGAFGKTDRYDLFVEGSPNLEFTLWLRQRCSVGLSKQKVYSRFVSEYESEAGDVETR